MNERNFNAVPKAACMFAGGQVEIGSNGTGAKSAPIKLKARSGDSIEHWYWGKVIHDLAGMRIHKQRLTVDYAHNDNEVLGYLNHFDVSAGDLVASGALTPWREDDRASEVMFKLSAGVPYEASIFFGGDGIRIEEVAPGMVQTVNGRKFEGPGIIIREWPLRGVAICPYGADQNTDAAAMSAGETIAVQTVKQESVTMNEQQQTVEAEAAVEGEKPVETPAVEAEAAPVAEKPESNFSEHVAEAAGPGAMQAKVDELTAQLSTATTESTRLAMEHAAALKERDELTARIKTADELAKTLTAERDEAQRKLAALTAGQPPVSSTSAETEPQGTLMQRARKKK
jgi:hypothetical protein